MNIVELQHVIVEHTTQCNIASLFKCHLKINYHAFKRMLTEKHHLICVRVVGLTKGTRPETNWLISLNSCDPEGKTVCSLNHKFI